MMSDFPIKVLIVDDEPLARRRIRALLADYAEIKIIGECANGIEALSVIEKHSPDLMFLDMQMPEMNGLSLLRNQTGKSMPLVIFVTAYQEHGLAAFETHAVDYLLKPFDQNRFNKAVEKAKRRLARKTGDSLQIDLSEIFNNIKLQTPTYRQQIAIRHDGRLFLIKTDDIKWIEAKKNYICFHVGRDSYLRRGAIGSAEELFDPAKFRRVHRSVIVNLNFIKELRSASGGDYKIIMLCGTELILSRSYQKNLPEFFE